MDTRRVTKGVCANNRFISLNRHVAQLTDQLRGTTDLFAVDICVQAIQRVAGLQDHGDFFQRAVTRTLTDTVNGTFYLTSTIFYCRQ